MSTKDSTTEIVLSEGEKQQIILNRQKEELAKKEKANAKIIADEKKIEAGKKRVEEIKTRNAAFIAVVRNFFTMLNAKFPGMYTFKETKSYDNVHEYNWYYKGQDVPEGVVLDKDSDKETIFEEKVNTIIPSITRNDTTMSIEVKSVEVKDGRFSKKNVYKMFIRGLWDYTKESTKEVGYINIDTVHERIQEAINGFNYRNNAAAIEKEGWDLALKQLTAQFPEAEVKQDKTSSGHYNRRGRYSHSESKVIKVKFKNGLDVTFSFHYWDDKGKMTLRIDEYDYNTNGLDIMDVIAALKTIKPTK